MSVEIEPTEHPYVVRHAGIGRGEPIIILITKPRSKNSLQPIVLSMYYRKGG